MTLEQLIPVLSAPVALLSLVATMVIYSRVRNRENYQHLQDVVELYSRSEMGLAIKGLWDHYREHGKEGFLDKYISVMVAQEKRLNSLPMSDKMAFLPFALHWQRRLVSQFWRELSMMMKHDFLPRDAVYDHWAQDDVKIVGEIIIPIENALAAYQHVSRLNPRTDPLYYILQLKGRFFTQSDW